MARPVKVEAYDIPRVLSYMLLDLAASNVINVRNLRAFGFMIAYGINNGVWVPKKVYNEEIGSDSSYYSYRHLIEDYRTVYTHYLRQLGIEPNSIYSKEVQEDKKIGLKLNLTKEKKGSKEVSSK